VSDSEWSVLQQGKELFVMGAAIQHREYDSLALRSMGHTPVFFVFRAIRSKNWINPIYTKFR
jgi:hypothetical protein